MDRNASEKKKIMYVVTKSNWGGAQRYVYDLITSLPREGEGGMSFSEKSIAFGKSDNQQGLYRRINDIKDQEGINAIDIEELQRDIHLLKEFKIFLKLLRIFKQEEPDIVHLNSSKAGGIGALAARLSGVPKIIFTAHGWPFYEDKNFLIRSLIKFLSWVTVALSHFTIVVSEKDLHAFDNWPLTKRKIIRIYNGVRDKDGLEKTEALQELQERYNVRPGKILIGTVAELHRNKGLTYLIKAMKKLPQEVHLCIIGGGELERQLKKLVQNLELTQRVFFTGFVTDAAQYMRAFDIFVLPSVKEGFPFALLEAGTSRLPVVATTVGGIPEIIDHKQTGLLVPPKNTPALIDAISHLTTHPDEATVYGKNLAERVARDFSFNTTRRETIALYETP